MNYIGSKHKLSSFLKKSIKETVGEDLSQLVFCDLFAGTGIVGRNFKPFVKKVIANDVEFYSYVLNRNYIGNYKVLNLEKKIKVGKARSSFIIYFSELSFPFLVEYQLFTIRNYS